MTAADPGGELLIVYLPVIILIHGLERNSFDAFLELLHELREVLLCEGRI